jgi:voltage-gated potassium channel
MHVRDITRLLDRRHLGFTDSAIRLTLLGPRRLTPARAVRLIAILTLLVTVASGVAMRLVDGREFPTIALGLWWAAQTVTTVGYGDVVPRDTPGRIVALLVMFNAVGFMTVVTGALTATLIEGARNRGDRVWPTIGSAQLDEINSRLKRLEAALISFDASRADDSVTHASGDGPPDRTLDARRDAVASQSGCT